MSMTITKTWTVDYAHRLLHHQRQCHNLHGHTATIHLTLTSSVDPITGMIIDFGELKEKITPVIDLYDHVLILNEEDPLLEVLGDQELSMWSMLGEPTAENFASRIARQVQEVLGDRAMVQSVTFYETPNNCATWTP